MSSRNQPVLPGPGICIFDYGQSSSVIRDRHLETVIGGGFQVSPKVNLASQRLATRKSKSHTTGGVMDPAPGAKRVLVTMTHTE